MAFTAANLALISSVNGFGLYRYDTLDTLATVDGAGYINNLSNTENLKVGDMLMVYVWATAVRTGTISAVGMMVVMAVNATTKAVDLSNDLLAASVINSD